MKVLGQDLLTNLEANASAQAQQQAVDYANQLYQQYQVQIWLTGIALITWMVWVSRGTVYSQKLMKGKV